MMRRKQNEEKMIHSDENMIDADISIKKIVAEIDIGKSMKKSQNHMTVSRIHNDYMARLEADCRRSDRDNICYVVKTIKITVPHTLRLFQPRSCPLPWNIAQSQPVVRREFWRRAPFDCRRAPPTGSVE